ncbi:MAG: glutamate-cysteine ligase family protein [Gemmatimonadota bacterium]
MSRLTAEEIHGDVLSLFSPAHLPNAPGAVGVEIELLPVAWPDGQNRPEPLPLQPVAGGHGSLLEFLHAYGESTERLAADWDDYGSPRFRTERDGLLVFEPGGQLEYSTEPRPTAAAAHDDARAVLMPLREAAAAGGIRFLDLGMNPFHTAEDVGLHLQSGRYRAMDSYFAGLGPFGQQMMRLTASLQVNLDFGDPERAGLRWRAANLMSPVLTAAFANSPVRFPDGTRALSGRALVWQGTDPSRTGLVMAGGDVGRADPWRAYAVFALTARVMMRFGEDGALHAVADALRFNEWWAGTAGAPPSAEDWRVHLTTLFPEIRPRGWLEIRSIDAPGPEWWGVPITLLPAILYDDRALQATLDLLEPHAGSLEDLARRSALDALGDPELGRLSEALFRHGLDATTRFPEGYFDADMVGATGAFRERYVARRRTQADERLPEDGPALP